MSTEQESVEGFTKAGSVEKHGPRFRIRWRRADGTEVPRYYDTREEAEIIRSTFIIGRERDGVSVNVQVAAFIAYQVRHHNLKTPDTRRAQLESMFQLVSKDTRLAYRGKERPQTVHIADKPLSALTPLMAQRLYLERSKMVAAATHHGELIYARKFGAWCVEMGLAKENPFAKVIPIGEANVGKEQLKLDEARRFIRACYADRGNLGNLGSAISLTLGMRADEICQRVVRELDDGGKELQIVRRKAEAIGGAASVKSKESERIIVLPPLLRAWIAEAVNGKAPGARILAGMTRGTLLKHVYRICAAAGVPDVCTHGLRGTFTTQTRRAQSDTATVAKHLGHADQGATARRHYMEDGTEQSAAGLLMERRLFPTGRIDDVIEDELEAKERDLREQLAALEREKATRTVQSSVGSIANNVIPLASKRRVS